MKARAAVILIENDKIALIERWRAGMHYYVFPGGKIEAGETPEQTAKREILEELGLEVKIGRLVAEVWYLGTPQYYFLAKSTGGQFGKGNGKEMSSLPESEKGSHVPIWIAIEEVPRLEVLPKLVARFVQASYTSGWPSKPMSVVDQPPDEMAQA